MIKKWIAKILKIPQTYWVTYEKHGKKIFVLVYTNGKETKKTIFSVEHLLNENLEVTEQTLKQENRMFVDA